MSLHLVHEAPAARVIFGRGRPNDAPSELDMLGSRSLLIADRVAPRVAKSVALTSGLPILAVPTTYAGSEATPVWGLTEAGEKRTGRDLRVAPRVIIYDPVLTASMPAELAVSSALDARAHCVDVLWPDRPHAVERRDGGAGNHAETHAVVLPQVIELAVSRAPEAAAVLERALEAADPVAAVRQVAMKAGADAPSRFRPDRDGCGAAGGVPWRSKLCHDVRDRSRRRAAGSRRGGRPIS